MPKPAASIEPITVTTEIDRADEAHVLVQRFWLYVTSGPDAGQSFSSADERVVIGTHETAHLRLTDSAVSRFHCEISRSGERAVLRDQGSKNGVLVDGVPVLSAPLRGGAVISLGRTQLRFEVATERTQVLLSTRERFGIAVGGATAMRKVFGVLEQAATSNATILLEGETGTGKEVIAESIHSESPRAEGPFIVVDCASVPRDLLESELFGHERGAFTGALSARVGALEAASGGTLFFDEIGELGPELQPKLLRAIERREVKRVGSNRYVPIDVRLIAATNRNLRAEVNAGRFRSDLYYRLAVVEVRLPPLRDRFDDLAVLVEHILQSLGAADRPDAERLRSEDFLSELRRHSWPGNVRELRNYVERCLAVQSTSPPGRSDSDEAPVVDASMPYKAARDRWTRVFERRYLEAKLEEHGKNVTAAARASGLDRIYFYRLLWRNGLR